jgi:hypothetical protein
MNFLHNCIPLPDIKMTIKALEFRLPVYYGISPGFHRFSGKFSLIILFGKFKIIKELIIPFQSILYQNTGIIGCIEGFR